MLFELETTFLIVFIERHHQLLPGPKPPILQAESLAQTEKSFARVLGTVCTELNDKARHRRNLGLIHVVFKGCPMLMVLSFLPLHYTLVLICTSSRNN